MLAGRPFSLLRGPTIELRQLQRLVTTGRMSPSGCRVRMDRVGLPQAAPIIDAAIHILCGTMLIATLLLPWSREGNASILTGNALAGFLLTDGHRLAAIAIYGTAAVGCLVIAAGASRCALIRGGSATLAGSTLGGLLIAGALGPLPVERWGDAPILGAGGAAIVLIADLRFLLARPAERHAVMS